ncbi:MAG: ABC transporter ATP-binding protein [Acidimicrobiia bacterium]
MSDPIISAAGLNMAFGQVQALNNVDLQVPAGRIGLVGANGAGKSTLIKILLGMLRPSSGATQVFGTSAQQQPLAVRSRVGYMPEGDCFPPDQSAADFVSYAAELGGLPPTESRQRASEVLTLVGLAEERFRNLGEFSTGMKQRAKLAQAIVHSPELVLLDEPASGLDPDGREDMLNLINRLGTFGMSVVFSSHVLGDIERTCDWVVMLNEGRLLRNEPLATIRASNAVQVVVLGDPEPAAAALRSRGARTTVKERAIDVEVDDGDPFVLIRDVLAETGTGLRSLGAKETTLEDVYLAEEEFTG